MRRYVHLGINPDGASPITMPPGWNRTLETLLTRHADWYRYGAQNYVLCTDAELSRLAALIRALPGFGSAYVLLTELAGQYGDKSNGWMDAKFWEWLHGKRDFNRK